MKRALAAVALALGATLAMAQSVSTAPARSASKAPRSPVAAAAPAASADASKQAWERTHRASRIIGMDVVNRHGEKVGDIEDIVLDRNGNAAYAVVSTGGFLGVGDKLHAIPWRSLEPNAGGGQFLLDIDKDALGKAPGFDNSSFPDVNDPKWSAENRRHFPVASSTAARSATMGAAAGPPRKREHDDTGSGSGRSPTGNDVGTNASTSRRTGPAAGTGSSTTSGIGSTSGTAAGSGPNPDSGRKPPGGTTDSAAGAGATNPAGGTGNPAAPASPGPANSPTPGTLK